MDDAIYSVDGFDKKVLSRILMYEAKREWNKLEVSKPDIGSVVVIRLCDNETVIDENDLHIFVLEDLKVAKLVEEDKWEILPPHPLFDYSPLSNKSEVNEKATISHWSNLQGSDLDNWNNRLNQIREYGSLDLTVDDENLELVYKSLLHGAHAIAAIAGQSFIEEKDNPYRPMYEVLSDLQAILDKKYRE